MHYASSPLHKRKAAEAVLFMIEVQKPKFTNQPLHTSDINRYTCTDLRRMEKDQKRGGKHRTSPINNPLNVYLFHDTFIRLNALYVGTWKLLTLCTYPPCFLENVKNAERKAKSKFNFLFVAFVGSCSAKTGE